MALRRGFMNVFKQFRRTHTRVAPQEVPGARKMNAWQVHSYGDLNELQLSRPRFPLITDPNSLLIKVEAASVNPIDLYMMHGYGRTMFNFRRRYELEFPLTFGRDFSGTVIEKGHGVGQDFTIGDKVYGVIPIHEQGSHAEFVIADKSHVALRPEHLTPVEAASILYASLTAWSALYITGGLSFQDVSKTKILILGASGGVGTLAVQILKSQGAFVVGTCSTDAVPLVISLGADQVFDYKNENYYQNVASQGRYDIILDCAKFGYQNVPSAWKYTKYVTLNSPLLVNSDKYGLLPGVALSAVDLIGTNIRKYFEGASVRWGFFAASPDGLKFIDKLVKDKRVTPMVDKTFKFDETPKAFEVLSAGHLRGKIVIDMQH